MLHGPAYPAARLIAPKIQAYFVRARDAAAARGRTDLAALPDGETIEAIIEAAFWASLRREEGYVPRISIALLSRDASARPLLFERPLALRPALLTRVAPAVERAGIHLGVWRDGADLCVWGMTQHVPPLCLVLEVAAPGLLVIKHHRGDESGKYINVAVLEGDQIKLVDERASILSDCPTVLPSLLGFDPPDTNGVDAADVLVQLAVSMRAHGRGGSLLVVPGTPAAAESAVVEPAGANPAPVRSEGLRAGIAGPGVAGTSAASTGSAEAAMSGATTSGTAGDAVAGGAAVATEAWRESIVRPMLYAVSPAYGQLAALCRERPDDRPRAAWQDAVTREVYGIAGLTAVDGATVLTTHYEVLAFGATITRRKGWAQVDEVKLTEPIEGGAAVIVHPEQLGGTRHQSAAQFAHDQRDAVALVASHDGRFTVFAWSPLENVVHAHRVEALLL